MKWFWLLVLVVGFIYALTTDDAQRVLHSDPMGSAQERASEIDEMLPSNTPGNRGSSGN